MRGNLEALGCFVLLATCLGLPIRLQAQARPPTVIVVRAGADAADRGSWVRALEATVEREDGLLVPDLHEVVREHARRTGVLDPSRVQAWTDVSALLQQARTQAASLHEGRALTLLSQAERIAEQHADVPGAATWLAEVETTIGLVAAQIGLAALSESALQRAATLDPTRGVRSAEAPPQVLAQANAIARAVATGPVGSFRVVVDVAEARVLLDEGDVGAAPRIVRAPVGTHLLRVEAPGFLPFGQVLQILPGQRADVSVSLSRDPLLRVVDNFLESAAALDMQAMHRAQAQLVAAGVPPFRVWVLEIGRGPQERALLTICSAAECAPAVGLSRGHGNDGPLALDGSRQSAQAAWLMERAPEAPPPQEATPLWQRWYVWAGLGVIASAAVGTTLWLTRPTDPAHFEVTVNPGDLHR